MLAGRDLFENFRPPFFTAMQIIVVPDVVIGFTQQERQMLGHVLVNPAVTDKNAAHPTCSLLRGAV
jgi:hypothetical protein